MRVPILASVGLLGLVGCGSEPRPCAVPAGCLGAERVDGACTCVGWETVSTETVLLPFVVTDVIYPPAGTATVIRYGVTSEWMMEPRSSSWTGTSVRTVIRRQGGGEQVARVGSIDPFTGIDRVSDTVIRIGQSGVRTLTTRADLSRSGADSITVWTNPAATVITNYVGEKTVDWSVGPSCFVPGLDCTGHVPMAFSAALLRGKVTPDVWHEAFLAAIGADGRAALLAFDPRAAGSGVAFPRHLFLGAATVDGTMRAPDATWRPCADPGRFEVLAEMEAPLADGDAFVLQYGVQADGTCDLQRPGLLVGTTTPGCSLEAQIFVDRLSGALLMEPWGASSACSGLTTE